MNVRSFTGTGALSNSYLVWPENSPEAVVVDCAHSVSDLHSFVVSEKLHVKWILLTSGRLEQAARAQELSLVLHAKIAAPAAALVSLQRLPQLGEAAGLCGVHSPVVAKLLKDGDELQVAEGFNVRVREVSGALAIYETNGECFVGAGPYGEAWEMFFRNFPAVSDLRIHAAHHENLRGSDLSQRLIWRK